MYHTYCFSHSILYPHLLDSFSSNIQLNITQQQHHVEKIFVNLKTINLTVLDRKIVPRSLTILSLTNTHLSRSPITRQINTSSCNHTRSNFSIRRNPYKNNSYAYAAISFLQNAIFLLVCTFNLHEHRLLLHLTHMSHPSRIIFLLNKDTTSTHRSLIT